MPWTPIQEVRYRCEKCATVRMMEVWTMKSLQCGHCGGWLKREKQAHTTGFRYTK